MSLDPSTSVQDRTRRGWPVSLGVLVFTWTVLCALVVGWGLLLVHPLAGSVGRWDDELARWVAARRTPGLTDLAAVGQSFGNTITGQVVLLLVAATFALRQRSVLPVLFVAVVDAGLLGIYFVATHAVPRSRPPVRILDPGLVPGHSFPSGHVETSVAIFGSVVALTWAYRWTVRRWTVLLLVLPLCVVVARVYQGAHHLSDALTSLVFAPVWAGAAAAVVLWGRTPETTEPPA